uniref:SHSP domain-containing protein n=1 Tax=Setaria italica TaxID=4555 RepID=K3XMM8_SETIT
MSLVRRSNVFDPFSLDLWDPFDNMFRSIVPSAGSDSDTAAFAAARIDWKETPEAHVFKADLPGVKKEEVKVEVEDGNVLVISGQRSKEKEDKNDRWHRVERSSGQFMRLSRSLVKHRIWNYDGRKWWWCDVMLRVVLVCSVHELVLWTMCTSLAVYQSCVSLRKK